MREPDFESSADMRLLELQRGALGLPQRERLAWESRSSREGGVPLAEADDAPGRGAVLAVEATAHPSVNVIAGAVVTLTLSIANEGSALAANIVAAAPLPGGAAYRPGTFVWNGRSSFDDVAETFFGSGLAIGALAPAERATFTWKIGVRMGTKPILVAPSVRAESSAVIGCRPVIVGRRGPMGTAFGGALARADGILPKPVIPVDIPTKELPFYELDEEEQLVAEAAEAALSTAAPRDVAVASPAKAAAPVEAPQPEPEPEPIPAGSEGIVLYGRFDRTTIAFFERAFFGTKPPTVLQHCIFGGAIACPLEPGRDAAQIKAHLDAQSQVLHRIALHEKLGKKEPIAEYAGELLAKLDALSPDPGEAPPAKDGLLLVTTLSHATAEVLRRISAESVRWDFVRARQLTLALQAESLEGSAIPQDVRARVEVALRSYAQASVGMLQRLFVRMRLDRTTGVLAESDGALDEAARTLVSAFKLALP